MATTDWLDKEKHRQARGKRVGDSDYYIAGQASGKEGKVCVLPSPPLPNAQFKTSRFVFLRDSAVGVVRLVLLNLSKRQVDICSLWFIILSAYKFVFNVRNV